MPSSKSRPAKAKSAKSYKHPESESPMRPEVGTQAQFKKKLPPQKYRYDDSLAPVLEWDGQNPARERGEARIAKAESELAAARKKLATTPENREAAAHLAAVQQALDQLKAMSKPFLNWAGKAERLSFDVPTLPPTCSPCIFRSFNSTLLSFALRLRCLVWNHETTQQVSFHQPPTAKKSKYTFEGSIE